MPNNKVIVRSEVAEKIDLINQRLNTLKKGSASNWKTNLEFRWNPSYTGNAPIRIDRVVSISELLEIHASIRSKHEEYEKSASLVIKEKVNYPTFKWMDYTYEEWDHDIRKRIDLVTHQDQITKLQKAKALLETLLTEEDRKQIILAELKGLLD